ncbi:type I restriction enzyme S subunit [Inquilinus ginsengisoli]|uniref:restriction endonuclease subunit S n=1 Tax=Inquilinus ginsengisoli TaxID=363840 RepID=UPI003D19A6F7
MITAADVTNGRINYETARYTTAQAFHELLTAKSKPKKNDILLTKDGALGRLALVGDETICVNQSIAVLRANKKIMPEFLKSLLEADTYQNKMIEDAGGSTIKHIYITIVNLMPIAVPRKLSEQHAIAAALSDADALIASLDALIAKKRDLKQATMQQLLTGKTRLPGFKGKWETKPLGDVSVVDPENLSARTNQHYAFKYISLEDVSLGELISFSQLRFYSAPSRARRKIIPGDILVSTVRPNLQSHLLFLNESPDWICSTGFSVVRCVSEKSHSGYIFQHFFGHVISEQIGKLITGSNYPAISSNDVRALQIPMPAIDEQAAIAAILSEMDAELAALESKREKVRALKQGMMQELLTGRIRLI